MAAGTRAATRIATGAARVAAGAVARLREPATARALALGSLVGNVVIVVTGGAVRLTGSGLGCPTWPQCTAGSYTTTSALGVHGAIEFGNRLLTFVLAVLAILVVVAVTGGRHRRAARIGAFAVLAGIPAQGVIGGLTVLTHLNPWVRSCHFVVSFAVITAAYLTWRGVSADADADGADVPGPLPAPVRHLAWLTLGVTAATVVIGAVVTASGPHAGDERARRTGLDPEAISQIHADVVFLLIGLSVALWFTVRAVAAPPAAVRAVAVLLAVELAQGAVGVVQYATHLQPVLVGVHMLGSCLVWIAALAVLGGTGAGPVATAVTPKKGDPDREGRVAQERMMSVAR